MKPVNMHFLYISGDAEAAGPGTALQELLIWVLGSHWKGLGSGSRARAPGKRDLFSEIRVLVSLENQLGQLNISKTVDIQYSPSCPSR